MNDCLNVLLHDLKGILLILNWNSLEIFRNHSKNFVWFLCGLIHSFPRITSTANHLESLESWNFNKRKEKKRNKRKVLKCYWLFPRRWKSPNFEVVGSKSMLGANIMMLLSARDSRIRPRQLGRKHVFILFKRKLFLID